MDSKLISANKKKNKTRKPTSKMSPAASLVNYLQAATEWGIMVVDRWKQSLSSRPDRRGTGISTALAPRHPFPFCKKKSLNHDSL
jgi:hypothetical protein